LSILLTAFSQPIRNLIQTMIKLIMTFKNTTTPRLVDQMFCLPLPEASEVQLLVLSDTLDSINQIGAESLTVVGGIEGLNIDMAINILKNFASFLDQLQEKAELTISICSRVLHCLYALGYHCAPEIKKRMTDTGLLSMRNIYLCRLLIENTHNSERDMSYINYHRVTSLNESKSSLYAYFSVSSSKFEKPLQDQHIVLFILGMFMDTLEELTKLIAVKVQLELDYDKYLYEGNLYYNLYLISIIISI
jgi:hypothetical protein